MAIDVHRHVLHDYRARGGAATGGCAPHERHASHTWRNRDQAEQQSNPSIATPQFEWDLYATAPPASVRKLSNSVRWNSVCAMKTILQQEARACKIKDAHFKKTDIPLLTRINAIAHNQSSQVP